MHLENFITRTFASKYEVNMPGDDSELERVRLENTRRARLRVSGFLLYEISKAALYFVSFLPLFLSLSHFRADHPAVLLGLVIVGFYVAGTVFLSLLVFTKRFVVGSLETNQVVTIETSLGQRFFLAAMLNEMFLSSPFRWMVSSLSPLTSYFYRGMGAKMATSVFISPRARIADPWFVEIQENATIGDDAVILGHAGHGRNIILGSVFIGEGAIIGMRSVLLPDVRVGCHARVAAGAVVVRGTVIADGETWAGVPARKISTRSKTAPSSCDC
jgi:acetyltransferase-like isoleucine patch superfamily enzyme